MEYYRIAAVARPHGVHGGVKLQPLTDSTARFRGLKQAYLEQDGAYRPVRLSDVAVQPDSVTLRIEGVDSREQAEALRGVYLCVDREHAVQLPPDTYFVADLIGCEVTDTAGNRYGHITDVLETGANDVYEITDEAGKETLVPALKRVLHEVDVAHKRVVLEASVVGEVAVLAD